jgi:serine/threonine-protein kinase
MSPEQVMGKDADARSDIYGVGLVLYECLTGETLFREGDVLERQLSETPPPPGSRAQGVPEALDQLVMKCIEKEPDRRFRNARELLTALRGVKG